MGGRNATDTMYTTIRSLLLGKFAYNKVARCSCIGWTGCAAPTALPAGPGLLFQAQGLEVSSLVWCQSVCLPSVEQSVWLAGWLDRRMDGWTNTWMQRLLQRPAVPCFVTASAARAPTARATARPWGCRCLLT